MSIVFVQRPVAASLEQIGPVRRFVMIWAPAFAGVGIVATESTPTFSASQTSSWLRPLAESLFGSIPTPVWEEFHHLLRKGGHFGFYGLLSILFVRGWLLTFARDAALTTSAWRWRSWSMGMASIFFVASCDELHQAFLPSRTGLFSDVVLDTCGGLFATSVVMGIGWAVRRSREGSSDAAKS